jgi:hypothetical protein
MTKVEKKMRNFRGNLPDIAVLTDNFRFIAIRQPWRVFSLKTKF